jgi:hypothetical protein
MDLCRYILFSVSADRRIPVRFTPNCSIAVSNCCQRSENLVYDVGALIFIKLDKYHIFLVSKAISVTGRGGL